MVDPLTAEHVDAGRDVGGRAVLGGMAGAVQPGATGEREALGELLGRVRGLGRVHPEPDQLGAAVGEHLFDHLHRHLDRVLAVDVGDEEAPHAEVGLGGTDAVGEPVDDGRHGDTTRGVQRRVEEHLAVLEVAEAHAVLERLVRDARRSRRARSPWS